MFDSGLERIVVVFYCLALASLLWRLHKCAGSEGAIIGFALAAISIATSYIVEKH